MYLMERNFLFFANLTVCTTSFGSSDSQYLKKKNFRCVDGLEFKTIFSPLKILNFICLITIFSDLKK